MDVFELPARWRAEIIKDFRLRGEERCAAASPGSGFPQLLDTTLEALDHAPSGPWVDLGGGLGGVGSWLQRRTSHCIILVDPAEGSLRSARELFGELAPSLGLAEALPLRSGSVSVVIACGLLSLLDDVDPALAEIDRVLRDDGLMTVVDLWSETSTTKTLPPNTFWSMEDIRDACAARGLAVHSLGVSETAIGWWSSAADQIDEEMRRRHGGHPAFARYERDRRHIAAAMSAGHLIAGAVTFGRRRPGD